MSISSYEAQKNAVNSALSKASKKNAGNKILKKVAKKEGSETKRYVLRDLLNLLLRETVDMVVSGEMTLVDAIDDFAAAAKAIDMKDLKVAKGSSQAVEACCD